MEILIYDIIGQDFFGEGITAQTVKDQLDAAGGEDITVRINSPGGDVFQGFAIHNLLMERGVDVVIDGLAASAASVIAAAGNKVTMHENALIMIHNPYTFALGDSAEMSKTAERLDKVKDAIISTYSRRTSLEGISELMDAETWFSVDDAIEAGLADERGGDGAPIANFNQPWVKAAPQIQSDDDGGEFLLVSHRYQNKDPIGIRPSTPDFRIAARAKFPVL